MAPPRPDFIAILETLARHRVDCIVVGGVCAALHGVPISTFDLDLVHSREKENVDRLLVALDELGAVYREQGGRIITPERSDLSSTGHHLLMTAAGPLDLLGEIGRGKGYAELFPHSVTMELSDRLTIRLLRLGALIETKKEAGRDKDNAVIAILERTLEESGKG